MPATLHHVCDGPAQAAHAVQWNPIWYHTDIFAEHGLEPPETWEELLQICDTLHAEGYIPITLATSGWAPPMARWFTILNMRLNGPAFHERLMRGEERYDDERVRQALEHWATMIDHNCFSDESTNYPTAADQIHEGEAAMYNLGEWLSESYNDGMPENFDFLAFPCSILTCPVARLPSSTALTCRPRPSIQRKRATFWPIWAALNRRRPT